MSFPFRCYFYKLQSQPVHTFVKYIITIIWAALDTQYLFFISKIRAQTGLNILSP